VDWVEPTWNIGLFGTFYVGRTKHYTRTPLEYRRADLTLVAGMRGTGNIGPVRFQVAWAESIRLNYMFQTQPLPNDAYRGVDLRNRIMRLSFSVLGS
jgi:hypothetical protein